METTIDRFDSQSKRLLKVYYLHSLKMEPHPMIRITGKYLEDFDFEIGDNIEVKIEMGRIVITKVNILPK